MASFEQERSIEKDSVIRKLSSEEQSALKKYQTFFLGSDSLGYMAKYELLTMLFGPLPGALGLFLRKQFYPGLFKHVGSGVAWGRNITLRHPGNIWIGDRVAIDDDCFLDAKGAGEAGVHIGSDVLVARSTIIQAKTGPIRIGDHCVIGSQCQFSSAGGIEFGQHVMLAGQSYIGGGRYRMEDLDTPMMEQGLYTKGPVVVEDDVWVGAGAIIQDGVHIGRGSVIGAGAVIREDVPAHTVVVPHQRLVMLPRQKGDETGE